ncbi:MAG: putative PEP-binding protein [Candidatus Helarchaeota archaeon]
MSLPKIYINLGFPKSIDKYLNLPFDGIGVFRIEFMIATYIGQHPGWLIDQGKEATYTDKLIEGLSYIAEKIYPRPIVVRFSDFKTNEYRDLLGGTEYEIKEENPMLGWRGASRFISEKFNKIFRLECQSIKKIREKYDNVWTMIPFVRCVPEAKKCLKIMEEEGLIRSETFKIWLMAETPAVPLIIDEFNKLPIDGYSIGSNDLCQLVLGVDRDHSNLAKMGYFDERNPAVQKAIEMIIKGAHRAKKTCSICGECVSEYMEIVDRVVELDVDSISVSPGNVKKIRDHLKSLIGK